MKLRNVEQLTNVIGQVINTEEVKNASAKLRYALIRNLDKFEPELKRLQKLRDAIGEALKPFEEERVALIKELGKEKPDGSWEIEKDSKEMKTFEKRFKTLQEKYKEVFDQYEAKMKEFADTVLEEESDIVPYAFSINLLDGVKIETEPLAVLTVNGLIVD